MSAHTFNIPAEFKLLYYNSDIRNILRALAGKQEEDLPVRLAISNSRSPHLYASQADMRGDYADETVGYIFEHTTVREVEEMLSGAADMLNVWREEQANYWTEDDLCDAAYDRKIDDALVGDE